MYASNLQELLFYNSHHSDFSPQVFAEFAERFNSLRSYGHLPKGREHRNAILTPSQIASAVLGLLPARPSWAGHATTVLKNLKPVGGSKASFRNATTLIEAMSLLLKDSSARNSFVSLRVVLGETGVNNNGGAVVIYEHEGVRKQAFFMSHMAVSLAHEGAEISFDFERQLLSSTSREMRFGSQFFERVCRAMETAIRYPGEPAGDGLEYDEEEAKQELWKNLGVTPSSRFLNMAADNHVTWPKAPTLVRFDGYHFILMPRTKENVQSVHIDLTRNRLNDSDATTVIRRFLSVMAWCDDSFATLGFGWSGNSVPVAVTKPELAFRTTHQYIFDRKSPSTPEACRALALYREALNAEHGMLISYAVLNYYKIIELAKKRKGSSTIIWFKENFAYVRSIDHLADVLKKFDKFRGTSPPHKYIENSCRNAVAHAGRSSNSDPDEADELQRLHVAAEIMQALARHFIKMEFKISDCMFDGT